MSVRLTSAVDLHAISKAVLFHFAHLDNNNNNINVGDVFRISGPLREAHMFDYESRRGSDQAAIRGKRRPR